MPALGLLQCTSSSVILYRMGRSKTPQLKKQESYKHDRVEGGEYPHADRRNRPVVKALGKRQVRHRANQFLATNPDCDLQPLPTRPKKSWRNSSRSLTERLKGTQARRNTGRAHNILDKGYTLDRHARFRRVLLAWVAEASGEHAAALAELYHGILTEFPEEGVEWGRDIVRRWNVRRAFLSRFFACEPELKDQFKSWIDAHKRG